MALYVKVVAQTAVPTSEATREAPPVKGANKRPPTTEPKIVPNDECVFPILLLLISMNYYIIFFFYKNNMIVYHA
jgi:hypothetical protein